VGREALKRPAVLAVIDEIARKLGRLRYVRKTLAITEYLKEINRVMHGGDPAAYRLPTDRRVIAAYLEMAAGQDRERLEKLVNFEYSKANVTIMTAWPNTKRMRHILDEIRGYLARDDVKKRLGPGLEVEVTGMAPMLAHVADRMVDGQIKSFFSALAVICLMMILVLWSVRVGLLAMIPNVLPIVVTLGLMGWLGINLNVTTVMIASIALGIAVDDTIHMLVRMRYETRQAGGDHDRGVNRALHSVGRAVVFTSLVLSGGFAILLLASLIPAGHFGIMVSVTMLTALLADVVLTPALIHWVKPWTASRDSAAATAAATATAAAGQLPAPSAAARAPTAGAAGPTEAQPAGNAPTARAVQGQQTAAAAREVQAGTRGAPTGREVDAPARAGSDADPATGDAAAQRDPAEEDTAAKTGRAPDR